MVKNGGSAFPYDFGSQLFQETGMTLRDYFAAAALQGMVASGSGRGADDHAAQKCYQLADAMLRAREQA